ncbi:hypothetical protein ACUOA5_43470, partial [Escherichia coli]
VGGGYAIIQTKRLSYAGEVFGLQEASGMKGVLFRAKDAIKEKFGARWLPAKAKNSDFPGNWWIIETIQTKRLSYAGGITLY